MGYKVTAGIHLLIFGYNVSYKAAYTSMITGWHHIAMCWELKGFSGNAVSLNTALEQPASPPVSSNLDWDEKHNSFIEPVSAKSFSQPLNSQRAFYWWILLQRACLCHPESGDCNVVTFCSSSKLERLNQFSLLLLSHLSLPNSYTRTALHGQYVQLGCDKQNVIYM